MSKGYSIINAITAINPTAQVQVSANDVNKIEWNKGTPVISNEDILAKVAELRIVYEAKQYQRARTVLGGTNIYPSWQDQMDMQYHDQVNGTTTWKDAVKAVKDAHPKS